MKRWLLGALVGLSATAAQAAPLDLGYLFVGGKQVFTLAPLPGYSIHQRASLIRDNLLGVLQKSGTVQPISEDDVAVKVSPEGPVLTVRGVAIATITPTDAQRLRQSPKAIADRWASSLKSGFTVLKVGNTLPENFIQLKDPQGLSIPLGWKKVLLEAQDALSMAAPEVAHNVRLLHRGGVITMSGRVSTIAARQQAEALVAQVPRIWKVDNFIEVMPSRSSNSSLLEQDLLKALGAHALTQEASISAKIVQGKASLSGTVPSLVTKDLAGEIAGRIDGVTHIDNLLVVIPPYPRPDEEIRRDLVQRLEEDLAIGRSTHFGITVESGIVTLSGQMESLQMRQVAHDAAKRISGVTTIIDRIQIEPQ